MDLEKIICVLYRNHRGETAFRRIIPGGMSFGISRFHPDKPPSWLLEVYDVDKKKERTFYFFDILGSWPANTDDLKGGA
jgi:hypothetical protein